MQLTQCKLSSGEATREAIFEVVNTKTKKAWRCGITCTELAFLVISCFPTEETKVYKRLNYLISISRHFNIIPRKVLIVCEVRFLSLQVAEQNEKPHSDAKEDRFSSNSKFGAGCIEVL